MSSGAFLYLKRVLPQHDTLSLCQKPHGHRTCEGAHCLWPLSISHPLSLLKRCLKLTDLLFCHYGLRLSRICPTSPLMPRGDLVASSTTCNFWGILAHSTLDTTSVAFATFASSQARRSSAITAFTVESLSCSYLASTWLMEEDGEG
ncbi:hypothetical protein ACLOJK_027679 [Asimina triloba]